MLCLARTVSLLVVGRLLQGASAAIVWTVGQALLVDTVGQKEIGQTLGWVSISMSVSILIAPLLGGVVLEKAGYYSVFYMAFGLIALDIFLRLVLVEKKIPHQWLPEQVADSDEISTPEQGSESEKTGEEKSGEMIPEDGYIPESESAPGAGQPSKYPPVFTLLKSRRLLTALWGCIVQGSQMTAFDGVVVRIIRFLKIFVLQSLSPFSETLSPLLMYFKHMPKEDSFLNLLSGRPEIGDC
jgi:MFS family permease